MDGNMIGGLRDFDSVWARVTGEAAPECFDEAGALREFMEDEARDAEYYAVLSRRARSASGALSRMSADERGHLRALRTEYYLLTGCGFEPAASCPLIPGVLCAMRRAHETELEGAEAYRAAAERTGNKRLQKLYLDHAGDETRHAQTLRELISRAIG